MRLFLVGFMGAGKSTVGRLLAERFESPFVDLDQVIESAAGMTIRRIFEEFGESRFRILESAALSECATLDWAVVALGGGAFVSDGNRDAVRSMGVSVWIDCPLQVCLSRVGADSFRPLLQQPAALEALYQSRLASYGMADIVIDAGDRPAGDVATLIEGALKVAQLLG